MLPFDCAPRYLIFDNDKKYGADVVSVIEHNDTTHLGLGKGTPSMRTATLKPSSDAEIAGHSRIGGLHHRYEWRQAA